MNNDHDLLIKISADVSYIKKRLDEGAEKFREHEERLREEEMWTTRFKTGIGIIAFVVTVFGAVMLSILMR